MLVKWFHKKRNVKEDWVAISADLRSSATETITVNIDSIGRQATVVVSDVGKERVPKHCRVYFWLTADCFCPPTPITKDTILDWFDKAGIRRERTVMAITKQKRFTIIFPVLRGDRLKANYGLSFLFNVIDDDLILLFFPWCRSW